MIGYKIGIYKMAESNKYNYCLIKLRIPKDAKVVMLSNSPKRRCDKAEVLSIRAIDFIPGEKFDEVDQYGNTCTSMTVDVKYKDINEAESWFRRDNPVKYVVGKTVQADMLNEDKNSECTNGIHFFGDDELAFRFLLSNYGA